MNVPESLAGNLEQILSQEERARAAKFRFPKNRKEFVVARGFLRVILGRYQKTSPSEIRFRADFQRKPVLSEATNLEALRFNLSHSHPFALLAVARDREIGVDVEKIRDDFDMESIASQFLSPNEISSIHRLAAPDRREAFYRYWTRKEAWLKATGTGFLHKPKQSEVARMAEEAEWSVIALDSIPGCAAALAVSGQGWTLRRFGFTPAVGNEAAGC